MSRLADQNTMQLILLVILLACGYLFLLQIVFKNAVNRSTLPVLAVLLLLIYGGVTTVLVMVIRKLGSMEFTFIAMLMLAAMLTLFLMLVYLFRHFRQMRKGAILLFLMYALAIGYVTIFMRHGENDTSIFTGFTSVEKAIRTRSFEPLEHLMRNVVLFVPLGFLFPMMQPEELAKVSYVLPVSLMCTVTIESVQLMLRLGQCDIEDIVANTLGGVIGLLIYKLLNHGRRERE